MNIEFFRKAGLAAIAFLITTIFAISSFAQIKITLPIGKPTPKPTTQTIKNPPATLSGGGGASRQEVNAFMADLRKFETERLKAKTGVRGGKGVRLLKNMADQSSRGDYTGCGASEENMRMALDEGAAFAEIVKAKYPTIENPTWTDDPESMAGDFRRAVENRGSILQGCISTKLKADLASQARLLDEKLAKYKADPLGGEWAGFILTASFDDPAAFHERLSERYKASFTAVGLGMPDNSIFAEYDAALKRLVDEARRHAGDYKWTWNLRDAGTEAKARTWFAKFEPKGTITKIGMLHNTWQTDGVAGTIPKGRYKRGYVMYKKPGLDQCVVASFAYEQDYMGGGKYNEMAVTSGFSPTVRMQKCN